MVMVTTRLFVVNILCVATLRSTQVIRSADVLNCIVLYAGAVYDYNLGNEMGMEKNNTKLREEKKKKKEREGHCQPANLPTYLDT